MPLKDPEARKDFDRNRWLLRRDKYNEIRKISGKQQRDKIKREVLTHYSKQTVGCTFCGEEEIEFLTIDHIDGREDAEHPAGFSGDHLYFWLKRNSFPPDYQVLCFNCNSAKEFMKITRSLSITTKNIAARNHRKKK